MIIDLSNYQTSRQIIIDSLPRHSVGAEIGVNIGEFSKRIIKNASPVKLHLIDPWKVSDSPAHEETPFFGAKNVTQNDLDRRFTKVLNDLKENIESGQVVIHRELSGDAVSTFSADYFDFVYIDGDHSYQGVFSDLELYSEKVKNKGLLILDDYAPGNWWGTGIIDACHDFLTKHRNFIIDFKTSTQVVLRRFK